MKSFLDSRPLAEILNIGDELLKGSTLNTNAKFLGRMLLQDGFKVRRQTSCPDQLPEIQYALRDALQKSDLVILSGGLGPTPDDVTREAVSDYFDSPLEFSKSQFALIQKIYRKRGANVPTLVRKEAMFPKGSVPLINRFGIALGFYLLRNEKMVVVLPGVPRELENMYVECVRPAFLKVFKNRSASFSLIVKMVGISEPEVMRKLRKDFFKDPMEFGIYPSPGEVALRIYSPSKQIIRVLGPLPMM